MQAYAEIEVDDRALVLCHYAFRTWKNMGRGWLDLHGHSHGLLKRQTRQYDVGVDVWDYRPVTLETILSTRRPRATAALLKRSTRGSRVPEGHPFFRAMPSRRRDALRRRPCITDRDTGGAHRP